MTLELIAALGAVVFVGALVLALVYYVLHYHGPTVDKPEFEARPIYYGVGFACYQVVTLIVAVVICALVRDLAPLGLWFGFAVVGGGGGLGMLTAYQMHELSNRAAKARIAAAARGTIDE